MDDKAERLAAWVRTMPLADQIVVTGSSLILADVKARNPGIYEDLDEEVLWETQDPAEARRIAQAYVEQYEDAEGEDGQRVRQLCAKVADTISQHFPA